MADPRGSGATSDPMTWNGRPLFEGEDNRLFRVQRYRVKARDGFHCTQDSCPTGMSLTVVDLDGKPFVPGQKRSDDALTTRCDRHRKRKGERA